MAKYIVLATTLTVLILGLSFTYLNKSSHPNPLTRLVPAPTKPVDSPSPVTLEKMFSQDHTWTATLSAERTRTMMVTGDVIPARMVNIQTRKYGNYTWPYHKTAHILKDADVTFTNLETPLMMSCPEIREGFTFCGDDEHIQGLLFSGVDIATIANNHISNFGIEGVDETTELLKKNDIQVTGRGGPTYRDVKGLRFAFLGYNDIGTQAGVVTAEEKIIEKEIQEARSNADVVVVQYHWGVEYVTQPSSRQKDLGRFTIDSGADLVIGNHPHWIQPVEVYKNKLITYAHGNFVFDQEWSIETKRGVLGKYTFYDNVLIDVEYFPIQIEDFGQPHLLEGETKQQILEMMYRESLKLAGK